MCSFVVGDQRFGRPCCLHLQGGNLRHASGWRWRQYGPPTLHTASQPKRSRLEINSDAYEIFCLHGTLRLMTASGM